MIFELRKNNWLEITYAHEDVASLTKIIWLEEDVPSKYKDRIEIVQKGKLLCVKSKPSIKKVDRLLNYVKEILGISDYISLSI